MAESKQRQIAESKFERTQRRKAEVNDPVAQEAARHAAAVKNMQRLRALRLARERVARSDD